MIYSIDILRHRLDNSPAMLKIIDYINNRLSGIVCDLPGSVYKTEFKDSKETPEDSFPVLARLYREAGYTVSYDKHKLVLDWR